MRRLLIRPGGIGDCILTFPVMEFLAADYTEVWVPGAIVPLVRWADKVAGIADTGLELFGVGDLAPNENLLARLRTFDSIVSWYGANRDEFRATMAQYGLPVQFHPALPPPTWSRHATDFFAAQAGAPLGLAPKLSIERAVHERASVVIHPFSGSPKKNWPLEKFRELARELPLPVEWLAGPDELLEEARRFHDLRNAAEWIAGARVYIGNDSGMTHLAAATEVPVIALFGPTDPRVWAPRGENVTITRWEPIRDLPVSEILQEVRRALGRA